MRRHLISLSLLLSACTAEVPVDDGLAPPATGVIEGDAVVLVPLEAPAPVILFLVTPVVDETGNVVLVPVNLTVIPASELTVAEGTQGSPIVTGAFQFPTVTPGTYYIQAFVDTDQNYNPLAPNPTGAPPYDPGDILGGYVQLNASNPAASTPLPIVVAADQVVSQINVLLATLVPFPETSDSPTPAP